MNSDLEKINQDCQIIDTQTSPILSRKFSYDNISFNCDISFKCDNEIEDLRNIIYGNELEDLVTQVKKNFLLTITPPNNDDISYHTDNKNKNSFLYLMDRDHVEFDKKNSIRRQWRGISVCIEHEHLLNKFLDVKTNIRLLDVCESGSGYSIRWWLYRNLSNKFFLVYSTSAKDHESGKDNIWKFVFYEYTENEIRNIFLNDIDDFGVKNPNTHLSF